MQDTNEHADLGRLLTRGPSTRKFKSSPGVACEHREAEMAAGASLGPTGRGICSCCQPLGCGPLLGWPGNTRPQWQCFTQHLNPGNSEGQRRQDRQLVGWTWLWSMIPFLLRVRSWGRGVAHLVQCLPATHRTLCSLPSSTESKPGVVVHVGNPSTQEDQKCRLSMQCRLSLHDGTHRLLFVTVLASC